MTTASEITVYRQVQIKSQTCHTCTDGVQITLLNAEARSAYREYTGQSGSVEHYCMTVAEMTVAVDEMWGGPEIETVEADADAQELPGLQVHPRLQVCQGCRGVITLDEQETARTTMMGRWHDECWATQSRDTVGETPQRCIFVYVWADLSIDDQSEWQLPIRYRCNEIIDAEKLVPYRRGQGVCHRHERGFAGWTPADPVAVRLS